MLLQGLLSFLLLGQCLEGIDQGFVCHHLEPLRVGDRLDCEWGMTNLSECGSEITIQDSTFTISTNQGILFQTQDVIVVDCVDCDCLVGDSLPCTIQANGSIWVTLSDPTFVESSWSDPVDVLMEKTFFLENDPTQSMKIGSSRVWIATVDMNRDGSLTTEDLIELISQWGGVDSQQSQACDLNADGLVDVFDLILFLDSWRD